MCFQNGAIKDHSLVIAYEGSNNSIDGEDSDIYTLGPGTNDNVAYTSIDSNKSTCQRYKDNITYNYLMKKVTMLCTIAQYNQEYCRMLISTVVE